jgi:hypothetical protein
MSKAFGYARSATRILISFGLMACAGPDESSIPSAIASTPDAGRDVMDPAEHVPEPKGCASLPIDATAHEVVFEIWQELAPGEEMEVCSLQSTGPNDIWLNSTQSALSPGAHHGLLFLTGYTELPEVDLQGEPIELGKVVPCESGPNVRFGVTKPLSGSQGPTNITEAGILPSDVAVRIPANSYVVMDFHMLNATDAWIDACFKVGIDGIPENRVQHEAGVLLLYNPFITVPAGRPSRARMACPVTRDISLKSTVSHMHARGVRYEAQWLDGDPFEPLTASVQILHETTEWESPPQTVWEQPLQLRAGDWIDYVCEYENPGDRDIAQGLDTVDEMCMLNGIYWPEDQSLSYCVPRGGDLTSVGAAGYAIGSGKLDGPAFINCVLSADYGGGATEQCGFYNCKNYGSRYAWQACFTQACEAIGKHTRAYMECLIANVEACGTECQQTASSDSNVCLLGCLQDSCQSEDAALRGSECE